MGLFLTIQQTGTTALAFSVLLFLAAGATLVYTVWFLKVELKLHGSKQTFANKFVVLSVSMGILSSIASLLDAGYCLRLIEGEDSSLSSLHLQFWMNNFFIIAIEINIYLLYLRTTAIMQFAPKLALFLKYAVIVIQITGVFEIIVVGISYFHRVPLALLMSSYISLSLFCTVTDCISAGIFAWHIREQNKFQKGTHVYSKNKIWQTTDLIASTGLWISLVYLVNTSVYLIIQITPVLYILTNFSSMLWMRMKLKLEDLSTQKNEKTYPTEVETSGKMNGQ
jgi:hypothetical protein